MMPSPYPLRPPRGSNKLSHRQSDGVKEGRCYLEMWTRQAIFACLLALNIWGVEAFSLSLYFTARRTVASSGVSRLLDQKSTCCLAASHYPLPGDHGGLSNDAMTCQSEGSEECQTWKVLQRLPDQRACAGLFLKTLFLLLLVLSPLPNIADAHPSGNIWGHGAGALTAAGSNKLWNELSETELEAASKLGYDELTWDLDGKVPVDRLLWKDLTRSQQEAAKVLNFNQKFWDEDVFVDIYERSWNELTEEQKKAAKVLGYKKSSWNKNLDVWSDTVSWKQLNAKQKEAAGIIGYTEKEWNESRHVYDKEWNQLSPQQKEAAKTLGYTVKRWNENQHVWSDDVLWKQLNDKQKKAAHALGFNEISWDRATKTGSHSYDREETRKKQERQSWLVVRWKSWIWKQTIGKKYCWVRGAVGGNWVRKIVGEQYDFFRGSKYCNYPN
uniref:Uncharacterized protein n=1 Tax=Guillardia theta TaxID=55529 RepID=A0A7S4NM07_GUITH|mmetsp:Transcript_26109/g.85862  ORF Transcript_26109/g.85862 Transcript_26109/m.85862 type:complete len:441 (+) Transcript_26109:86-1408(+)